MIRIVLLNHMVNVLGIDGLLCVSLLQDSPLLDVFIAFLCLGSGREMDSERDSYTVNYLVLAPDKDTLLCDFFVSQRN